MDAFGTTAYRAMTYNVRYAEPEDGVDAWPHRRDDVAGTLRFHRPDVVGLQEVLPGQLADVDERLPAFDWVGSPRTAGGERTPVGYRTDRLDVLDHDTFWLSETPERPGVGWDAQHPRVATWARLRPTDVESSPSGEFVVVCTHLDFVGERARKEGARLVRRRFADRDCPVVVVGDWNSRAGDPPYETMVDGPFSDAMDAVSSRHHGPTTTRTDFESLTPETKIDHVFVTPDVDVRQHGVATDRREDGRYPSDHLPVVVDFDVGTR